MNICDDAQACVYLQMKICFSFISISLDAHSTLRMMYWCHVRLSVCVCVYYSGNNWHIIHSYSESVRSLNG